MRCAFSIRKRFAGFSRTRLRLVIISSSCHGRSPLQVCTDQSNMMAFLRCLSCRWMKLSQTRKLRMPILTKCTKSPAGIFRRIRRRESKGANGMVFCAKIRKLDAIPESEMAEVKTFDTLPDNLTYPAITPNLFAYLKEYEKKSIFDIVGDNYFGIFTKSRARAGRSS